MAKRTASGTSGWTRLFTRPSWRSTDRVRDDARMGAGDRHEGRLPVRGRDAAGKGRRSSGSPSTSTPIRADRRAPAPSDREKTQWYFQRYVPHLPAAGEVVLLDRSWYNRAGVERVMGFCSDEQYWRFFVRRRSSSRCSSMTAFAAQVLVLGVRCRAGGAFPLPRRGPDAAVEALADGYAVDHPLGVGLLAGQGRHDAVHRHRVRPWYVVESEDKKASWLNVIAHLLSSIPYEQISTRRRWIPHRPPAVGYASASGEPAVRPGLCGGDPGRTGEESQERQVRTTTTRVAGRTAAPARQTRPQPGPRQRTRWSTRQRPRTWQPTTERHPEPARRGRRPAGQHR